MRRARCKHLTTPSALMAAIAVASASPAIQPAPSNEHRPVFFPDGDAIVFMSDRADGDWELYRSRLDGSDTQRLTRHVGWDGYADVSPDGRSIVFDRSDDAGRGIVLLDLDGGAEQWLVHTTEDFHVGGARFAPDGESILFASEESGSRRVYRLWLADHRVERLAGVPDGATDAVFSPDGRRVVMVIWHESGSTLAVRDLAAGTTRTLVESTGRIYGTCWSAAGQDIFFNDDVDGDQEIFVVDLDGGAPRRLTDNEVSDHLPMAAPFGDRILFTSERDGTERIYLMDIATGATVRLAPSDPSSAALGGPAFNSVNRQRPAAQPAARRR